MKLVLALFFFLLVQAAELPLMDGFSREPINVSVLKYADADRLFAQLKERRDIAYGYPIEGCWARATLMARLAEEQGIILGKIFVEGNLRVNTKTKKFGVVEWAYHVAPIVNVIKDGKTIVMVMDPSLFDHLVTVEEFIKKMGYSDDGKKAIVTKKYFGARFQNEPRTENSKKYSWDKAHLEDSRQTMDEFLQYDPTRTSVMWLRDQNDYKPPTPKQLLRYELDRLYKKPFENPIPKPGTTQ